ncbi:MAG: replication/maintenance protein RepL [Brasilonema angustatum HA4187-MV1]|jgi:hypothetical protein|nr:replication/maintenance protein RepL [Brasilonema angustatum HA4187-MV1]
MPTRKDKENEGVDMLTPGQRELLRDGEARVRDYATQDKQQEKEAEERKKSPYTRSGFTQLSDREVANLRKLTSLNPVATEIFLFLLEHMSSYNAVACPQSLLMKVTGKSRTTVHRAIVLLKESQFIGIKKIGATQVFHLNASIVWRSYGDKIKYAELVAPILLDTEENPELENLKVDIDKVNVLSVEDINIQEENG